MPTETHRAGTARADYVGRTTGWEPITCERWRAERLAELTGLDSPRYRREVDGRLLAPPTYLVAQHIDTLAIGLPDAPIRLNGGNRARWEQPVYTGDELERRTTVSDVTEKDGSSGRLVIFTLETAYRRPETAEVVARTWATAIRRYPRTAVTGQPATAGPPRRGPRDVGQARQILAATPSSRDLVRYASATDDFYEAHYDQAFARGSGLPDTIVHGLLKLGWLARAALDVAGPAAFVREIEASYRGIDPVGTPFSVWCEAADDGAKEGSRLRLLGVSATGVISTTGSAMVEECHA